MIKYDYCRCSFNIFPFTEIKNNYLAGRKLKNTKVISQNMQNIVAGMLVALRQKQYHVQCYIKRTLNATIIINKSNEKLHIMV